MNRKDDHLFDLAFDAANAEEIERAKKGLDAHSAKKVDDMRWLKEGLVELREVPEDQMSVERLRDAILGQGLKPHAEPSRWSWLWMPTTAGLTACALMFVLQARNRQVDPQIMIPEGPAFSQPFAFNFDPTEADPTGSQLSMKAVERETSKPVAQVRNTPRGRGARPSAPVEKTANAPVVPMMMVASEAIQTGIRTGMATVGSRHAGARGDASGDAAMMAAPAAMDAMMPDDSGVVLIQNEKDAQTGAPIATEVNSTNNVLVGG